MEIGFTVTWLEVLGAYQVVINSGIAPLIVLVFAACVAGEIAEVLMSFVGHR